MKKARRAVRKDTQQKFEQWCEENGRKPDPDSLIVFFKKNPVYDTLDYEKAKKEGYYFHLRAQAAAIIASWATVEVLKPSAGKVPFPSTAGVPEQSHVRLQYSYDIPGKGAVPVKSMNESDLKWLIQSFKIEAENKLKRAYLIAKRLERLTETRKDMRKAFEDAEVEAFAAAVA